MAHMEHPDLLLSPQDPQKYAPAKDRATKTVGIFPPVSPSGGPIVDGEANAWKNVAMITCLLITACAFCGSIIYGAKSALPLKETVFGMTLLVVSLCLITVTVVEVIWRAVLAFRYKPVPSCDDAFLPECTVVVPAFNEGKLVYETLQSLAASNYPRNKLRLVAIDDGSVDDTWAWIRKAKELLGDRVATIKQPCNMGKRHALYAGFQQSTGEILITVDSDSIVEADSLRNLVAPFVKDGNVGAVAGNLRVLNMDKGAIPRMLDVAFVFTCSFMRSSQSMVKAVFCTPGALSAYRRDVVMKVLQEWLHQTFCGKPANIGEDRALSSLILREGHHVVYQQNAVVYTEVPVTYDKLCKMYLRWTRGDIRETIALARFIFKPFRKGSMLGARINFVSSLVALTNIQIFLAVAIGVVVLNPVALGVNAVFGVVISSSLAALLYAWRYRSLASLWAFVYGFYSFVFLSWIVPYSLITPHKSGWLTRQIGPKAEHEPVCGLAGREMFLTEET